MELIRCGTVLQIDVKRRNTMRAFALACLLAVVIAVGAALILDNFVQESATTAFALPSARV
jgi:hypothetical protein